MTLYAPNFTVFTSNLKQKNCMPPIFAADMKVFALNTTVYPSNKKYIYHKYEIKLYLAQKKQFET